MIRERISANTYTPEDNTVTPSPEHIPAAMVPLSTLGTIKVYHDTIDGSKESKKVRREFLKPPNQHGILPSYEGTQTHQLLFYSTFYWWLMAKPDMNSGHPLSYYSPYQSRLEQEQASVMFKYVAQLPKTADYIQRAWLSFELWRQSQNFDIQLKRNQPKQHASKNFKPGKREAIWNGRSLTLRHLKTLSTIREAMEGNQNPLQLAQSILLEAPVNLYITSRSGNKMMSWAQPDLVFPRTNPETGEEEVVNIDYKLGEQLSPLEPGDHFRRLELLLSQLAAIGLAHKFFHGGDRQIDDPPFFPVDIDAIPGMVRRSRLWHANPQVLGPKGWFKGLDMTLSDEEVAAACIDLAYVIDLVHSDEKTDLKEFIRMKKQIQKGTSPTVQPSPVSFKHQYLLLVP